MGGRDFCPSHLSLKCRPSHSRLEHLASRKAGCKKALYLLAETGIGMTGKVQTTLKRSETGNGPYLEMGSISKTFGSIQALKNVDFEVRAGEVMALVGENGAGKSTLAKILAGIHRQDSGRIRINGREVTIHSPADSQELGIAVVQQELSLIPTLSVAENVFVGDQRRGFLLTPRKMKQIKKLNNRKVNQSESWIVRLA